MTASTTRLVCPTSLSEPTTSRSRTARSSDCLSSSTRQRHTDIRSAAAARQRLIEPTGFDGGRRTDQPSKPAWPISKGTTSAGHEGVVGFQQTAPASVPFATNLVRRRSGRYPLVENVNKYVDKDRAPELCCFT